MIELKEGDLVTVDLGKLSNARSYDNELFQDAYKPCYEDLQRKEIFIVHGLGTLRRIKTIILKGELSGVTSNCPVEAINLYKTYIVDYQKFNEILRFKYNKIYKYLDNAESPVNTDDLKEY